MKKLLIYTNGGLSIGLGHIMRTTLIASKLRSKIEILFASLNKEEFSSGHEIIKKSNFELILLDKQSEVKNINSNYLMIDDCLVKEDFFIENEKFFEKIICIDDECELNFYNVDILINPNPYAKYLPYNCKKYTKFLFEYKFLRDEFLNKQIKIKKDIKNIILTLGGSDDNNLSYKITTKIINFLKEKNINLHIVIGKAFKFKDNLKQIKNKNIFTYENAKMSELMLKSDIGICGCGQSVYEFCALKIPIIGLALNKDQIRLAKFGDENKFLLNAKNYNEILNLLEKLDYKERLFLSKNMDFLENSKKIEDLLYEFDF